MVVTSTKYLQLFRIEVTLILENDCKMIWSQLKPINWILSWATPVMALAADDQACRLSIFFIFIFCLWFMIHG